MQYDRYQCMFFLNILEKRLRPASQTHILLACPILKLSCWMESYQQRQQEKKTRQDKQWHDRQHSLTFHRMSLKIWSLILVSAVTTNWRIKKRKWCCKQYMEMSKSSISPLVFLLQTPKPLSMTATAQLGIEVSLTCLPPLTWSCPSVFFFSYLTYFAN